MSLRPWFPATLSLCGLLLFAFLTLGCSDVLPSADGESDAAAVSTTAPLLGAADGLDASDHDCQVALVEVGRRDNGRGGYLDNGREWLWFGSLDVDSRALVPGVRPAVMYQMAPSGAWWEVSAHPTEGGPMGFQRYAFELSRGLPGPGMSGTAITRSVIEMIPVLHVPGGGRLFDHNSHRNDFDNYVLSLDTDFGFDAGEGLCSTGRANQPGYGLAGEPDVRPSGVVTFGPAGHQSSEGTLVAGGRLEIDYDIERLSGCRATHSGYPSWDIRAFAAFQPGGQVLEASVRSFESHYGRPTSNAFGVRASFEIPHDAQAVDVWFQNFAMSGGVPCQAWDSNGGDNYGFDVLPGPDWMGEAVAKFSRAGGHACEGGAEVAEGFDYGSWPRTRAVMRNLCFEVWQVEVTDRDDPNLWERLDARIHWRFGDSGDFDTAFVDLVDQPGNNARFAFDVGQLDPFRAYACPDVPAERVDAPAGGWQEESIMSYYFTVNGYALRPSEASYFTGRFWDHPSDFRLANCE